ncbi:MAG: YtxH domain-containing protein [Candidatus Binatia bacterium]
MKSNGGLKFPYFLIAIGIGAMAGLLFALRAGEDTRNYLRERSDKGLDYLNRQAGKLRESAEGLVKKGKELMGAKNGGSVKTDTEAEKQAYEEEKRKHLGG